MWWLYFWEKNQKSPYSTNASIHITLPLALIHTNLCAPISIPSLGGALYFLLFIDDFPRFTYIYFLDKKSIVFSHFKAFKILVESQLGDYRIFILHFDNGGEFASNAFNWFCLDHGIQCQLTNPYNPIQNNILVCKNRTLVESPRNMVKVAQLSNSFWAEFVATTYYLQNCSFT